MDPGRKINHDVITQLRQLAHDLSNSIETIIQASYLISQGKLDANGKKWIRMIENAAEDAAQVNRGIREILRSQPGKPHLTHKPASKRRAS
jgi:hypothetical protein